MRAVGIRELKDKLSHYVRLAEAGESVLVTDRGTVVAELRPVGPGTPAPEPDPRLAELYRAGRAVPPATDAPDPYRPRPRALRGGSSRELLDAERGG